MKNTELIKDYINLLKNDIERIEEKQEIILEALEKQELKLIKNKKFNDMFGLDIGGCPTCLEENVEGSNYCSECGQALKW